jgi:hypothetical protein
MVAGANLYQRPISPMVSATYTECVVSGKAVVVLRSKVEILLAVDLLAPVDMVVTG